MEEGNAISSVPKTAVEHYVQPHTTSMANAATVRQMDGMGETVTSSV